MIYFTSDTHFCHSNIINLTKRPFNNYYEMEKKLIANWNSYVTNNDDIYILGDFLYKGSGYDANEIIKKLNGNKYLLIGNHDKFLNDKDFDRSLFVWIKDYYELTYKKFKFILFHYPILEWSGFFKDSIHLYGHVHNSSKDIKQKNRIDILGQRAYNVGVDVNNFCPVSIDKIIKKCLI